MMGDPSTPPLAGLRVLELSQFIAGPVCGCVLADAGADVVKLERPIGEDGRRIGQMVNGDSLYYAVFNRNKRGIVLDLTDERDAAACRELAATCDVVIENFRPGVVERLGLGFDVLRRQNEGLIMVSLSGFGQHGQLRTVPAFDQIVQALAGVMYINGNEGDPPMKLGISVADYAAGLFGAFGVVSAVLARERDGLGQHIDVALYDSMVFLLETAVAEYAMTGVRAPRSGNGRPGAVPSGAFECEDGWIYLAATTDVLWARLMTAMDMPADLATPDFDTNSRRVVQRPLVEAAIARWCAGQTVAAALAGLHAAGVPCAPVRDVSDAAADGTLRDRGTLVELDHPLIGRHVVPGTPIGLSRTPTSVRRRAPLLGEHNDEVFREWLAGRANEEGRA